MEPIFDVIENFQLRQIGEQTLSATQTMAEAIRHLNKADRAAALDLGADVFRQHHDAATRWNRQAQQQFRTERIECCAWPRIARTLASALTAWDPIDQPSMRPR